jgi:hypothetical protein
VLGHEPVAAQANCLTTFAIPWALILAMVLASGGVGVLAATLPALPAARLNPPGHRQLLASRFRPPTEPEVTSF